MPVLSALRLSAVLLAVSGGWAAQAADLPRSAYASGVPARVESGSFATAELAPPVEFRPLGPPTLEHSRYTGQPISVIYNDPTRRPGSVDPGFTLVPLGSAKPFHTRAVYPRGY